MVERTFGWLHQFKRLRARCERRADLRLGLLELVSASSRPPMSLRRILPRVIEQLLPSAVVTVEAYGQNDADLALFPEEAALMTRAVAKRRREFALVRSCARRAMEKLGVPPQPVLSGEHGAPCWPAGLVGSMTHCDDYCAAALVRTADLASLGIDAEVHQPLPEEVLPTVSLPAEADRLRRLSDRHPDMHWDRLLFSAKEAVYKAWFPLTQEWLDFKEADIEFSEDGHFRAALLVPGPRVGGHRLDHFEGRWTTALGLIATAVAVPHT